MIAVVALLLASGVGDDAIAKARAKYDNVEYDQALAILDKASAKDMPPGEKARVLVFKALVHAQMADEASAKKDLDDALALDQCVALSDALAPAKLRAMLQTERDQRATPLPVKGATATTATTSTATTNPATTTTPAAPAAAATPSSHAPVWAGAALAGAGALSLAAGGVFGAIGLASHDAAASAKFQSDVLANDDAARTDFVVANVLLLSGGALAVAGGVTAAVGFALE
jgi:hypothetical protein